MDNVDLHTKESANPSFPHDRNLALNEILNGIDTQQASTDHSKPDVLGQAFRDVLMLHDFLTSQHEHNAAFEILPENAARILDYLVKITLPPTSFAEHSPYVIDSKQGPSLHEVAQFHQLSHNALTCLSLTFLEAGEGELASVLTSLAAFTNTDDPWTTNKTYGVACKLIHKITTSHSDARMEELLGTVLQDSIVPAFAKTKNTKLTQQARRAMYPVPSSAIDTGDGADLTWKYKIPHVPTVFRWILLQLRGTDSQFVTEHWPFLIPPLLALIDDSSLKYKAAGCADLIIFLQSCPVDLLERTGLGEIFEHAVMPCLMYLPTFTEEAESLLLLSRAYPALLELAASRFPERGQRLLKIKALDRIMRFGILNGFSHAAQHIKIAEFLTKQLIKLIHGLDIDTAKHLRNILALLSTSLADPFISTCTPLLLASAQALQHLILACWPRLANTRGELTKLLTLAWGGAEKISAVSDDLGDIQRQLGMSLSLLITSVGISCATFTDELDKLSKEDPCFRRFLQAQ